MPTGTPRSALLRGQLVRGKVKERHKDQPPALRPKIAKGAALRSTPIHKDVSLCHSRADSPQSSICMDYSLDPKSDT
jgi:hypothetical protein